MTRILIHVHGVWLITRGIAGVLSGLLHPRQTNVMAQPPPTFWLIPASDAIGIPVGPALIRFAYRLPHVLSE